MRFLDLQWGKTATLLSHGVVTTRTVDVAFKLGWDFTRGGARGGRMMGENSSAEHGTAVTKDLPSPRSSSALLLSCSSRRGTGRSRAWLELVAPVPSERC